MTTKPMVPAKSVHRIARAILIRRRLMCRMSTYRLRMTSRVMSSCNSALWVHVRAASMII